MPIADGYYQTVRRIPWFLRIVVAMAVLGLVVISVPAGRQALLRAAGQALVVDDPVRAADAIVIAVDAHDAGIVEAADLVRSGMSRRVAIFADVPDDVDREFNRRGISLEDPVSRQTRLLKTLGVQNVELIPLPIEGSEDEGRVFPMWCKERQLRSVIVVASADHTRRLRRIFHRAMKGGATAVMVRRARFSEFDPDRWWQKRDGVRTEIVELEKLLFDFLRHPIS
jgi:hypothetical protein